jgi:MFS family permease
MTNVTPMPARADEPASGECPARALIERPRWPLALLASAAFSRVAASVADETSPRYAGWRVVAACFVAAMFCWGFGLYSHGIYLAELRLLHGWSASSISAATTAYYLLTAFLVVFISDAIARLGPRTVLLIGTFCLFSAVALLAFVGALWQLYAVYLVMAVGSAAMHVGSITNILGLWFDRQRGLAISLALNGASSGGILVAPGLVLAIAAIGFTPAMVGAAIIMAAILIPVIAIWIDRPPQRARAALATPDLIRGSGTSAFTASAREDGRLRPYVFRRAMRGHSISARCAPQDEPASLSATPSWTRHKALRSPAFWSVAAPFALALMAQVGFLVHQIALLEPAIGRTAAGLAVAVLTIAAVIGRFALGAFNLRLDLRWVTALLLLGQAAALFAMTQTTNAAHLFIACAVFGLSAGNLMSLPAMIVQREFEAASFGLLIGLSTAIGQFTYAFGPGLLGVVRDTTGSYVAPLALCMLLEIAAAGMVVTPRLSGSRPF